MVEEALDPLLTLIHWAKGKPAEREWEVRQGPPPSGGLTFELREGGLHIQRWVNDIEILHARFPKVMMVGRIEKAIRELEEALHDD